MVKLDPKFLRNQHWAKKFDKKHRNRKNKDKVGVWLLYSAVHLIISYD